MREDDGVEMGVMGRSGEGHVKGRRTQRRSGEEEVKEGEEEKGRGRRGRRGEEEERKERRRRGEEGEEVKGRGEEREKRN